MEPIQAYNQALKKREELQQAARNMGVTEDYISTLVDAFYEKVRNHQELGPVFNSAIQHRWPVHLAKMKLFWSSVALRAGTYKGDPMKTHKALTNASPHHFKIWLNLFEKTLQETAPNQDVVDYFMGFAHTMSPRLQKAMFS